MAHYSKEQFWGLYEKLPQELKDAVFAQETTNAISGACERNQIQEYVGDIADLVGAVLIGLLLPQDFQKEIEKLGIPKKTSEKVAMEINRFVFYPVKPALEQLHKLEIEVSAKVVTPQPSAVPNEAPAEEQKQELRKDDQYREPLE